MKNYKVLMIHNYYQIPGGEDTVLQNEINMLQNYGHEVLLYSKNNKEINTKGIVNKLKSFFNMIFSLKSFKEVDNIIKKNKVDIIHVHNTLLMVSPSVYFAAFKNKIPVVQTLHNFRFICPGATLTRKNQICHKCTEKGMRYSLLYKCYRGSFMQTMSVYLMLKIHRVLGTYKKINAYIALTEFNKNLFLNNMKEMRNIFVKPNFIFLNDNQYIDREIQDYFVYFGRLDEIKGIKNLLSYWSKYNGSKLVIIGGGPEEEYARNFIACNNIKNIELTGFMKRETVLDIVGKSKAAIIPSLCYEGFPMTIVESFSLGVPVIGSNLGNIKSIIDNERNGLLFDINNESQFIAAVTKVNNDLEFNRAISRGAYETFINKYTDSINYTYLINIYKAAEDDMNGNM